MLQASPISCPLRWTIHPRDGRPTHFHNANRRGSGGCNPQPWKEGLYREVYQWWDPLNRRHGFPKASQSRRGRHRTHLAEPQLVNDAFSLAQSLLFHSPGRCGRYRFPRFHLPRPTRWCDVRRLLQPPVQRGFRQKDPHRPSPPSPSHSGYLRFGVASWTLSQ